MSCLAVSNIAWNKADDNEIFDHMQKMGFTGIEIAPTKIFSQSPYDHIEKVLLWKETIRNRFGFSIPSMQSIWFGRNERVFGTEKERELLREYTKKAILYAEAIECHNLVFGCPRNRSKNDQDVSEIENSFFRELGDFAYKHNTCIGFEANPSIYHTNYINTTAEAIELIRKVDSKGFKLNLDVGTMVENHESISILFEAENLINHVHISEPYLEKIKKRRLHNELADYLRSAGYNQYISIEVKELETPKELMQMIDYVAKVFS